MTPPRRRNSAEFKLELVIELLRGEKDLNTIAAENNIQPNLLRNWKKEFLDKASVVFDDTPKRARKRKGVQSTGRKRKIQKKRGATPCGGGSVEKKI